MEDQKLLWIVFSVVLFVVVVLASTLYFLKPRSAEPALTETSEPSQPEFDTYEYVRGSSPVPPLQPQGGESGDLQIVVGEEPAAAAPSVPAQSARESTAAAVPESPRRTAASAAPAPRAPAVKQEAPRAASSAPSQPSRIYWIQTASFKSRASAESMVASLGEKGITGRIQVSDVGGQPYFRVRVGPYTSKGEADKFLAWIKGVKGLEQSYVSAVTRSAD